MTEYKPVRLKPEVRKALIRFEASKQIESGVRMSDNDAVEYLLNYYRESEAHTIVDDDEVLA